MFYMFTLFISFYIHIFLLFVTFMAFIGLRGLRQGARNCIWLPLLEKETEETACQFPALGLRKGSKEWISTHNVWLQTKKKRRPESMPNRFDGLTWTDSSIQICIYVTVCLTQTWLNLHVQSSIDLVTLWGLLHHFQIWHRHSKCAAAIGEVAAAIRCVGQHQKGSQVTQTIQTIQTIQANPGPFFQSSLWRSFSHSDKEYFICKYFLQVQTRNSIRVLKTRASNLSLS